MGGKEKLGGRGVTQQEIESSHAEPRPALHPTPKMKCPLWSLPGPRASEHLAGATGFGEGDVRPLTTCPSPSPPPLA